MSIKMVEDPESRDLHYGASGGGQTLRFTARVTAGETEVQVWLYAILQSPPYFNGFIRQDIKVRREGAANFFKVDVEYGTTGVGGGDQPLGGAGNDGGAPPDPTAPSADTTPLTSGYSFTVAVPQLHLTQSRATVSATGRNGAVPKDFKGAIGVDKDGKIDGCDVPPDAPLTWQRTVARASVTTGYLQILTNLAGRPNDAKFYGFDPGTVLYMGANGQFTQGEGWSITHSFATGENEVNIAICDGLVVPAKKAFEYLWVLYEEVEQAGQTVVVPSAAYVEEVLRPAPFGLIGIGA